MPTAPARILVVDDEPDLRTLYELTLLRDGHHVSTAANLAQASALLASQRFDVLITDMRLPDGLGMALLHELHQQQRQERSIVITAYGSAENAVEACASATVPACATTAKLALVSLKARPAMPLPCALPTAAPPLGGRLALCLLLRIDLCPLPLPAFWSWTMSPICAPCTN